MKPLTTILVVFGVFLSFGVAAVYAVDGNTTATIDPAKPPVTVVVTDPDGIASIQVTRAGGVSYFIDTFCINPAPTGLDVTESPVNFPLTLNVTDCDGDSTEFVVVLPSVGGATSFITDGSGSSGSIALLAGGVAAVVAIVAGGWYTRKRWLDSRS